MKILILGGTGAMGIHLVKLLAEANHKLVVTSRRKIPSTSNTDYIQGDAKDLTFVEPILNKGWDCIVDFMVYNTTQFNERLNLLLNNTKQYVYFSSSRVYANSETPITESSDRLLDVCNDKEYLATDEYALTKARQEDLLANSKYKNWTIIRPYITYSENRLQLGVLEKEDWLYRAMHNKTIILPKEILDKYTTLTYGLDVAKGIFATIGNDSALCERYHITCSPTIKWKEVLNIYTEELQNVGISLKIKYVGLQTFLSLTNKWQVMYDRMYNRSFNNTKISKQLTDNFVFIEPEVGLRNCIKAIIKDKSFTSISWHKHAKIDRLTGDFSSLKEISGIKQKLKYILIRFGLLK